MVRYVQHFWSLFLPLWIRHASSIHSRGSTVVSWSAFMPRFLFCSSLAISSINVAYSMNNNTPPCLMLSMIFIGSVKPYLVWVLAVSFEYSFLASLGFSLDSILMMGASCGIQPWLVICHLDARKITHAVLPCSLVSWIVFFSAMRWPQMHCLACCWLWLPLGRCCDFRCCFLFGWPLYF